MPTQDAASADGSDTLVVLLHAYTSNAVKLEPVESAVREAWPCASILRPELPLCMFSMLDPDSIVADILGMVDRSVAQAEGSGQPFRRIVLVGHSVGALLARKLYVVACGETKRAPFEPVFRGAEDGLIESRKWASTVDRIVLLAGMNRGWRLSHHIDLLRYPLWALGAGFGHLIHLVCRRWPLIFKVRRGAEFVTQLRLQWIFMRQRAKQDTDGKCPPPPGVVPDAAAYSGNALTIQLLGSVDDIVAPEDNVDLVSGGDFIYLDVPYSGHANVIEFNDSRRGAGRKERFLFALTGTPEELYRDYQVPSDEDVARPNVDVKKLVFVVHGIRDEGYWTHKIARRVKQRANGAAAQWAAETSSYGYFPMLPFLFYGYRRQRVEWLMDQYAEAVARHPCAEFSYVGHSNGTYLLAEALDLYPSCRFENVVLAGSVVSRRFDWTQLTAGPTPRVSAVLNFVATGDWVVAFFPKAFELFGSTELGGLGHDGFKEMGTNMYQALYVKGGHGAAIEEDMWDKIADFVLTGTTDTETFPRKDKPRTAKELLIRSVGRFPPIAWLIAAGVAWCIWRLVDFLVAAAIPDLQTRASGLGVALSLLIVWLVLTRV